MRGIREERKTLILERGLKLVALSQAETVLAPVGEKDANPRKGIETGIIYISYTR